MTDTNDIVLSESGVLTSWTKTYVDKGGDELIVQVQGEAVLMYKQPTNSKFGHALFGWSARFTAGEAEHVGKLLIAKAQELREGQRPKE